VPPPPAVSTSILAEDFALKEIARLRKSLGRTLAEHVIKTLKIQLKGLGDALLTAGYWFESETSDTIYAWYLINDGDEATRSKLFEIDAELSALHFDVGIRINTHVVMPRNEAIMTDGYLPFFA